MNQTSSSWIKQSLYALRQALGWPSRSSDSAVLANDLPQMIWRADHQGTVTWYNDYWYQYTGQPYQPASMKSWLGVLPVGDRQVFTQSWNDHIRHGAAFETEQRIRQAGGTYYRHLIRAVPLYDDRTGRIAQWVGTYTEIEHQRQAEWWVRFIDRSSSILNEILNSRVCLQTLAHLCVPEFADIATIELLVDEGPQMAPLTVAHRDPSKAELIRLMRERFPLQNSQESSGLTTLGFGNFTPIVDDAVIERVAQSPSHAALIRALDICSRLVVPLVARGKIFGSLVCIRTSQSPPYTLQDFDLMRELAGRATVIAENARLYEHESAIAHQLQTAFLPHELPQLPSVTFSSYYRSATHETEVGGDWYDCFCLPDGKIAIAIGDVAGHGIDAAVMMGQVRQAVRAVVLDAHAPSEVLERTNRLMCLHAGESMMVTALFAILDPLTRELAYANAGHPAPLILAIATEQIVSLPHGGIPLGIQENLSFEDIHVDLPQGALLTFYTDGLLEYSRDLLVGQVRLEQAIREEVGHSERDHAQGIIERLQLPATLPDDIAVLTAYIPAVPASELHLVLKAVPMSSPIGRRALGQLVTNLQMHPFQMGDIYHAVGEALNNTIEHAYTNGAGVFELDAWIQANELLVTVTDHGKWRQPREEGRGRGILLMKALSKTLSIENTSGGTKTTLTFSTLPSPNAYKEYHGQTIQEEQES